MTLFRSISDRFATLSYTRGWPELGHIMRQSAAARPVAWTLPIAACQSAGGRPGQALPAALAIACLHIGILLIDDLLDEDPRGHHHRLGPAATANLAAAFHLAGLEAIRTSVLPAPSRLKALENLGRTALATAYGQRLDVEGIQNEAFYWRVVRTKSAPFFGSALYLGALYGRSCCQTAARFDRIGRIYGEMVQISDDLHDAMQSPANPDWTCGRAPLPLLFAQTVPHPERERFRALRRDIQSGDNLQAAQAILIRCGAISYGMDQLLRRYVAGRRLAVTLKCARPDVLFGLLDSLVAPVRELFCALEGQDLDVGDEFHPPGFGDRRRPVAHRQPAVSA